jgi:Flp pilus assembly secretin CpaC
MNVAMGLLLLAGTVSGQDKDEGERPREGTVPLKVQLVVTKQLGDKKLSSFTYSIPCGDRKATVKLGVEVPVPVRKAETVEFQYRNVGANLECDSRPVSEGRFNVRIAFEHSSLYAPGEKTALAEESRAGGAPFFRTSMSQFSVMLRDGQTQQAVTGTDPVSGELTTVDVTLTLLK